MSSESDVLPEESVRGGKKLNWFWGMAAAVAVVGVVVAVVLVMVASSMTPEEVARGWVDDNVDMLGERVAGVVVDGMGRDGMDALILKELGGEWVEDRVHEHLAWTYSSAVEGSDGYLVVATGMVNLDVSMPPLSGVIEASAPFELLIKGNDVVGERLVIDGVSVRSDVAGLSVDVSGEKVAETAEKAGEKAVETLGEKLDGDDVVDEAGEKVKDLFKP